MLLLISDAQNRNNFCSLWSGYLIPAGWKVLPILSTVHLDQSIHSSPLEFDPWRWEVMYYLTLMYIYNRQLYTRAMFN